MRCCNFDRASLLVMFVGLNVATGTDGNKARA